MSAHTSPTATELRKGISMLVVASFVCRVSTQCQGPCRRSIRRADRVDPPCAAESFLLPFMIREGGFQITPSGNMRRGFLIATATLLFFSAVMVMPLADAISIFFIGPLLLTLLSAFFLGEHIGMRRITAVLAGFAGAILSFAPAMAHWLGLLLPVCTAFAFALYMIPRAPWRVMGMRVVLSQCNLFRGVWSDRNVGGLNLRFCF